jgi:hypothetical protein
MLRVGGRRVRVLRRDLEQLIADAEAPSRVREPTALDEGEQGEGAVRLYRTLSDAVTPDQPRRLDELLEGDAG